MADLLIVDDDDDFADAIATVCRADGHEVVVENDFSCAEARFTQRVPDAVVLDVSMPGMGGREVFQKLREQDPSLPVLFTSGYDPSDAANVAADTEAVGFLQKPYRPPVLVQAVQGLLAQSRKGAG